MSDYENQTDADRFVEAVNHYCKGYAVVPGCRGEQCEYANDDNHQCEPSFCWRKCDSCGSRLGGDRTPATMIPLDYKAGEDTMIECEICTDCLFYWANDDLPETWRASPQAQ